MQKLTNLYIDTFTGNIYSGNPDDIQNYLQVVHNVAVVTVEEVKVIKVTKDMASRLTQLKKDIEAKKQELKNLLYSYE